MDTSHSKVTPSAWQVTRLFSRVGACLLLLVAIAFSMETISVLQDSSDYVWTREGPFDWRYESEAIYITALIVEVAVLLLAGIALWRCTVRENIARAFLFGGIGLALPSAIWFDLTAPIVRAVVALFAT